MIENQELQLDEIEEGRQYRNCRFNPGDQFVYVTNVIFENCEFSSEMIRSEWLDCIFKKSILSNINFSDSIFYRCQFEQCQMLGTIFAKNRWKETTFNDVRADYSNFSESHLEKVQFITSQLKEASFQALTIKKGLTFTNCLLNQADFMDTKLNGIDFSTSDFDELLFTPTLLKGAKISSQQASSILAMMGVKISDHL